MPVAAEAEEVITIDLDARSIREDEGTRRRRILADPFMDSALKAELLDDTPMSSADLAELFGRKVSTIWDWRRPRMEERRPLPHPRMLEADPEPIRMVAGRAQPGLAAGRAKEWGRSNGLIYWRRDLKRWVRAPNKARGGPHRRKRIRQS